MLVFSSLKITDVLKQCTIEIALNLDLPSVELGREAIDQLSGLGALAEPMLLSEIVRRR